jgi:hypothetical protein
MNHCSNLQTSAIARPPETRDAIAMIRDALEAMRSERDHLLMTVQPRNYGKGYRVSFDDLNLVNTPYFQSAPKVTP